MKRETKAQRAARVARILELLDREYGTDYRCYLNHETPWQLLIAVILSAQCTDARVNIVTADLFKKYDSLEKFAGASLEELEQDIRSIGFYHMKAKNIIACCRSLLAVGAFGAHLAGGRGPEDRQCDPREHLQYPQHRGGHPREADFQKAGAHPRGRAGKSRVRSDEGSAGGSLDSLEYTYHHAGADDLHGQKPQMRTVFS